MKKVFPYKNLAIFLLILNVTMIFSSLCYILFTPKIAKAAVKVAAVETESRCNTHSDFQTGFEFKSDDNNQLLPCCFAPRSENGQTGSLTELSAFNLLLVKISGEALTSTTNDQSSYIYGTPAPPPELSILSSTVIRV